MGGPVTRYSQAWALGLAQIRMGNSADFINYPFPVLPANKSLGAMAQTRYAGNAEFFPIESGFPLSEDGVIPLSETSAMEAAYRELTPYNAAIARGLDPTAIAAWVNMGASNLGVYNVCAGTAAVSSSVSISVDDDAGPINEVWMVIFTSASAYQVVGMKTGLVQDGAANGTISAAFEPENGANHYFTIPADFFPAATWAAGDIYVFSTGKYDSTAASLYGNASAGQMPLGGMQAPEYLRMEAVYTFPNGGTLTMIYPRCQVAANQEIPFSAEDAASSPMTIESKKADSSTSDGNVVWDFTVKGGRGPLGTMIWVAP